jgi:hypothetical protein
MRPVPDILVPPDHLSEVILTTRYHLHPPPPFRLELDSKKNQKTQKKGVSNPYNAPKATRHTQNLTSDTLWPSSLSALQSQGLVNNEEGTYSLCNLHSQSRSTSRHPSTSETSDLSLPFASFTSAMTSSTSTLLSLPMANLSHADLDTIIDGFTE